MNAIKYLSAKTCVVLPTKSKPRVFLCVDDGATARLSFQLYNPFSARAKLLKSVTKALCVHANPLAKIMLPTIVVKKSKFIEYLEEKLNKQLISSVYVPTDNDKIVMQLQADGDVIGYVKYSKRAEGQRKILNEIKAISILSEMKIVPSIVLSGDYKKKPFIILQNLKGKIGLVKPKDFHTLLNSLKKETRYPLNVHPRIVRLQEKIEAYGLDNLKPILEKIISDSKISYYEVFEHGDFAPWNLIKTEQGIIPFDFEYFEEIGMEHLDEIKYHFQIEHLLNGKKGTKLLEAVLAKVDIEEIDLIIQVFLINEILKKYETEQLFSFEKLLLKSLQFEKA